MDDFLDFLLTQTLKLWRIVLTEEFFQEELFDFWEEVEFGFSLFKFVEDGFAETVRVSAGRLVFEEEYEDVVDILTVVEETVQENLIVMAVTVELVPFGRLLRRYLVEKQLFDSDLLEMVQQVSDTQRWENEDETATETSYFVVDDAISDRNQEHTTKKWVQKCNDFAVFVMTRRIPVYDSQSY